MSINRNLYDCSVVILGHPDVTAVWGRSKPEFKCAPFVRIMEGSQWSDDGNTKFPAHDFILSGGEALLALRQAINEALGSQPTSAASDVLAERQRQITQEGWTSERDDQYIHGDLPSAAAAYAMYAAGDTEPNILRLWPWESKWWKPTNPRRSLVKAAALLLAEIERLDRATLKEGK